MNKDTFEVILIAIGMLVFQAIVLHNLITSLIWQQLFTWGLVLLGLLLILQFREKLAIGDDPLKSQIKSPIFGGIALSIANILDAITTYLGLTKPNVFETNPLMRGLIARSWVLFFGMKLGASVFFVLVGMYLAFVARKGIVGKRVVKAGVFILFLVAAGLLYASWHNFHLYLR